MAKLKLNVKKPGEGDGNNVITPETKEISAPMVSLPESGGIRIILKNARIHAEKVIIKKIEK